MTVTDVTARIAQIQAQIALLPGSSSTTVGTTSFSGVLSRTAVGAPAAGDALGGLPAGGAGGEMGQQVVANAKEMLGLPYVWGGNDPQRGVDCSGLVQQAFKAVGIELPRLSADQARSGTAVPSMAQAQPGDLIAWDNSSRNVGADHIAIYIGNGQMIEAPRPGGHVQVVPVTNPPDYIRRVLPEGASAPTGAVAAAGAVSGRVSADTPYAALFEAAGATHGVDPTLLAAVARQESAFDADAVSPAGAQGLMQLMPGTAAGLGVANPFDPPQAVDGAARLLNDLLTRFGQVDLALAAYNAGPGAVMRYDGVPPYPETRNYVQSVMASWGGAA
ncbi:transglycosylase SLT domain-containing protein [Nocardioides seonyuensis]|uniref:transglycosylase SLT domain-containing protein n=1 Tax=Nocardioides seonyuensis TaxID=2518371 RepID=UPI001FCA2683|nr:transglycosylase SLT domain-containing protein [Nocardioides seonyuensis]